MELSIVEFCNRYYEPQITQSIYEKRAIEEMRTLQNYLEYLDFGENGFQRNKSQTPSGLKNIGNTCYFNVFIQLLFHINSIRDLFLQAESDSDLIKSIKELFAKMLLSTLKYSDPTAVFNELKRGGMQVGQQYDFHQYLSITLDTLQKCLSSHKGSDGISQDRYINRIFFGKMNQYFNDGETLKRSVIKFGVINLDVNLKKLEDAFQAFRSYEIEGYKSQKGEEKVVTVRSQIIQFPAILTFFVNRVAYSKKGNLQKNNSEFQYPNILNLDADSQIKSKISQQEQDLENKIRKIQEQLRKQQHKNILNYLKNTVSFLSQQQEFEDLQTQNHINFGIIGDEQGHKQTKERLQSYISKLSGHDQYLSKRIQELKQLKKTISIKSTSFRYTLFALMIHQGTAHSGHYYIIIKNQEQGKWWKFSDRSIVLIQEKDVNAIASGKKQKSTNVCCIFYKQKQLICDSFIRPNTIQASLKSLVIEADRQTIQNIKYAKFNSLLRGCVEIAEEEILSLSKFSVDFIEYFSQQKYFGIAVKLLQTAKFAAFKQLITESGFVKKLKEIGSIGGNQDFEFEMPEIKIPSIPKIYYQSVRAIKTALWIENPEDGICCSLQLLAQNRSSDKQMQRYYDRILNIVLLKACYRIDIKINKNQKTDELYQLILNILELLGEGIIKSQITQNLRFSFNSVGKKTPSIIKKQIGNLKTSAFKVPYVQIRSILNSKFKIWTEFERVLYIQGSIISQERRTNAESLEMVNELS